MKLAIVFWFYKNPRICVNRLKLIKKFNPNLKIYGLYGGDKSDASRFEKSLKPYLDDFYISPYKDSHWKWRHGDLMLLNWYEKRGKRFEWDSIVVVQWDHLVFEAFEKVFKGMKKGQIYLSGFRQLNATIEKRWYWTRATTPKERTRYEKFLQFLKKEFKYNGPTFICLFILVVLPRDFLEKYSTIKGAKRQLGFLEYKIPMLAKIFKIPVYKKDLGVLWFEDKPKPLNAIPKEIEPAYIRSELKKRNGWRIFHPYFKLWK